MSTLKDNHDRPINYVRLAVTDRCNLRCRYCMPAEGIDYVPRPELLTYEELLRTTRLLTQMGIRKVRITGGEPFLRKGLIDFIAALTQLPRLREWHLTTNGTLTAPFIPKLQTLGVASVNLSLDSLNQQRFFEITRRDVFDQVWKCLYALLAADISTKINAVILGEQNVPDLIPFVELTRHLPVAVRFIEAMPFHGGSTTSSTATEHWDYRRILEHLSSHYPQLTQLKSTPHATATDYQVPGFVGTVGVIPAFSRTFCGTCNRLRITPQGVLKTCLYDHGVFSLRDLLRAGATDAELETAIRSAVGHRARDGWEAERRGTDRPYPARESMSSIGG